MSIAVIDVDTLSPHWRAVLLRGVAGVLFGIATFRAGYLARRARAALRCICLRGRCVQHRECDPAARH